MFLNQHLISQTKHMGVLWNSSGCVHTETLVNPIRLNNLPDNLESSQQTGKAHNSFSRPLDPSNEG